MNIHSKAEEAAYWARLEKDNPRAWIRAELTRLHKLMRTQAAWGLEFSSAGHVVAYLKGLRRAFMIPLKGGRHE